MLQARVSIPARSVSTAARCRFHYGRAAMVPTGSIGVCCRWMPIPRKAISRSRSASRDLSQPMDWLGAEAHLIATRAIHFAATLIVAGTLVFRSFVAWPILRSEELVADVFRTQTRRVVWIGLLVAAISGAIWLLLQAA